MAGKFVKAYIKALYILCLSPLKLNDQNSVYQSVTVSQKRKILCGPIVMLVLFTYFSRLRFIYMHSIWENPTAYFRLFEQISSFMYKISFARCIWTGKDKFQDLLNYLESFSISKLVEVTDATFITSNAAPIALHASSILYVILRVTINPTFGGVFLNGINRNLWTSPTDWYNEIVSQGKLLFLFNTELDSELQVSLPTEICIFTIVLFTLLVKYLFGICADLLILTQALTLWIVVKGFSNKVKAASHTLGRNKGTHGETMFIGHLPEEQQSILDNYEVLNRLSEQINNLLGYTLLPYMGELAFSAVNSLNYGMSTKHTVIKCLAFTYHLIGICILLVSSQICEMMSVMRDRLYASQNKMILRWDQVSILLDSISRNRVSITVAGICPINGSFIIKASSAVLAYFIIQLQSPSPISIQ